MTIERAPVGIAHFDPQGRFLFVNPQLCALFGFSRDELLAMTFQDISFAEDLPRCFALLEQLTAGAIPQFTHEKRFERSDGTFIYTRVIVSAGARRATAAVGYFLAIVEDLSEQWSIDQARKDAEARLSLALEASGTGIYRYDFRKEALDWAHNLANVFGFPPGEELQSLDRMFGAIHPDDLPGVLEHYERSRTAGDDFDHEFRIVHPDARVRWISDRARMGPSRRHAAVPDRRLHRRDLASESVSREEVARGKRIVPSALATRSWPSSRTTCATRPRHPHESRRRQLPATSAADRNKQLRSSAAPRAHDQLIGDLLDVPQIERGQLAIERAPVAIGALVGEASPASRRAQPPSGCNWSPNRARSPGSDRRSRAPGAGAQQLDRQCAEIHA